MWLLKTEPGEYSYDDLEREKRGSWDGVANPVALRNLRAMKPGDRIVVYHTGGEKLHGAGFVLRRDADPRIQRECGNPYSSLSPQGKFEGQALIPQE